MPDPRVAVASPIGEKGTVAAEDLALEQAANPGGRVMSDAELQAFKQQHGHAPGQDIAALKEAWIADRVGLARGLGESVGIPLDSVATSIGGPGAKEYLKGLKERNPYASLSGDVGGQVSGFIAQSELGGPAGATNATRGVLAKIGKGAAQGAFENLVAGTTSDVNEAALGDHKLNAEKLTSNAMGHLLWGAGLGGAAGGAGHLFEGLARAGGKAGGEALESGANRMIGRELGLSGEGAAQTGARIRSEMSAIPKQSSEIASFYEKAQSDLQSSSQAMHAIDMAAMGDRHAAEQLAMLERQPGKSAKLVDGALKEVKQAQAVELLKLSEARESALEKVDEFAEKLKAHNDLEKNLATKLDGIEGAERPKASTLTQGLEAARTEALMGGGNEIGLRTTQGLRDVDRWRAGFAKQADALGEYSFSKVKSAIGSLDAMAERSGDTVTKNILSGMREQLQTEFDRASSLTSGMGGEATGLHAERLRNMRPEVEASHAQALEELAKHDKLIEDFTTKSAEDFSKAQELAAAAKGENQAARDAHKLETNELKTNQRQEAKNLKAGKPTDETPYDDIAKRARAAADKPSPPLLSPTAALGALLSLAHGNVGAAALALGGSLAAGQTRAAGNLGAARLMATLAEHLAGVDRSLEQGTLKALKAATREGALASTRQEVPDTSVRPARMSFERIASEVKEASVNPGIIELRVRNQYGALANVAPQTYSSVLESAQRAQAYLQSILPPSRKDPYSPTNHLEPDAYSESEKYDFMEAAKVVANPMQVLAGVKNGSLTDKQVETIKAVYPGMYRQMTGELDRNLALLQRPLAYQTSVHLAALFQRPTNVVSEPHFQRAQAEMFAEREKAETIKTPGSMPKGPNARMSKASMSGSQQVEAGEGH